MGAKPTALGSSRSDNTRSRGQRASKKSSENGAREESLELLPAILEELCCAGCLEVALTDEIRCPSACRLSGGRPEVAGARPKRRE
jgi:hypothetical protein